MEIIISVLLAYIIWGFFLVSKDLGGNALDRPMWAMRPTIGKAILIGATWFTRPFFECIQSEGQVARGIAVGLLVFSGLMGVLTFFIWVCIAASAYFFDSTVLRVVTTAVLMLIGAPIFLPLIQSLMFQLALLIAWPLNLLFPLKESTDVQDKNKMTKEKRTARAILIVLFIMIFLGDIISPFFTVNFAAIVRLVMTFILSYLVYMGFRWAKWFVIVFSLLASALGLFVTLLVLPAKNTLGILIMIGLSVLYGGTGLFLIFGKNINQYLEEKRIKME